MFIGETANTDMSAGLTVNQQAADDEILAIKSSDVTHGATDFAETDTYGHMKKSEADAGGLLIRGLRDNGAGAFAGLNLQGLLAKNTDTGKTNTAQGIVAIYGLQTSGASVANTVADGNICSFHTYRGGAYVTVVIIDEDGDIYYEGGMVEYDEQDDIALLRELNEVFSQTPAENTIHARARKARPELERVVEKLGFVHINEDGSAFVSTRRERALLRGAAVQSHDMLMEKIAILEARLVELEASRE